MITGEMRSGTTFLANLLNSQEQLLVYSDMLISLFSIGKSKEIIEVTAPLIELQKNLLVSNLNSEGFNLGLNFDHLRSCETWIEMLNKAYDTLLSSQENHKIEFVGVKKTNEPYYLKALLDNGVKILYVARDPRDVIYSNKNRFSEYSMFSAANRLKENLHKARSLEKHPNLLIVRYHELILDKYAVKSQIESFLSTSLDFDLTELTMRKDVKYKENSSFGDVKKLFDPSGVNRWKSKKDLDDVIFANVFFKDELNWLYLESDQDLVGKKSSELLKQYKRHQLKNNLKSYVKKLIQ